MDPCYGHEFQEHDGFLNVRCVRYGKWSGGPVVVVVVMEKWGLVLGWGGGGGVAGYKDNFLFALIGMTVCRL